MVLRVFALGSAGQAVAGRLLRLALGGAFRGGPSGVLGATGAVYGAPGTMGELVILSNTSFVVQPVRAVVQNTQDDTQGQYMLVNDTPVTYTPATTPAMPSQDASQFRRALVVSYVRDAEVSGVASTAISDAPVTDILAGPLAPTAGGSALPAAPPNAYLHGELVIPPAGQNVTAVNYNLRTVARGGILPVVANTTTFSGHGGAAPLYDGEYRDHPTYGLQRGWGGNWTNPLLNTGWIPTPGVGGQFVIGSGGSQFCVRSGWCDLRTHIAFAGTLAVGDNQPLFTLPAVARPLIGIAGPHSQVYGGNGHGQVMETVLGTDGALVVNGRGLTADGLQIHFTYPAG